MFSPTVVSVAESKSPGIASTVVILSVWVWDRLAGVWVAPERGVPAFLDDALGEVAVQWTKSHVCFVHESAPPYHPFWVRA
jgi:hypothetical protein